MDMARKLRVIRRVASVAVLLGVLAVAGPPARAADGGGVSVHDQMVEAKRARGYLVGDVARYDALKAAASLNGPSKGIFLLTTEPDLDDRLAALEPLETEPTGLARNIPPKR